MSFDDGCALVRVQTSTDFWLLMGFTSGTTHTRVLATFFGPESPSSHFQENLWSLAERRRCCFQVGGS